VVHKRQLIAQRHLGVLPMPKGQPQKVRELPDQMLAFLSLALLDQYSDGISVLKRK